MIKNEYNRDQLEYYPTGKLSFKLDHWSQSKEWNDGSEQIEEKLPSIIATLEIVGEREKEDRIQREKARLIAEQKRKAEEELRIRVAKELTDFKTLLTQANRWYLATMLRTYIEATKSRFDPNEIPREMLHWFEWANRKADWFDPMTNRDDELLKNVDKDTLTLEKQEAFPQYGYPGIHPYESKKETNFWRSWWRD
jgi:hypothetical protein